MKFPTLFTPNRDDLLSLQRKIGTGAYIEAVWHQREPVAPRAIGKYPVVRVARRSKPKLAVAK